jgi:hypothetical protein
MWDDEKSRLASIREDNRDRSKKGEVEGTKINQALGHAHKVVKIISASLSALSYGSTIFGEIALIPSS